jgi:aspartate aminotransferase-like enzyme
MTYDKFDPEGQKIQLFTPGPVYVPDWILKEFSKPNDTHRCNPYRELHGMVKKKMQKLLHTKDSDILLWTNSGTGIMEACIRNLIGPDDKAIFFPCGAFGERWANMAEECGKNAVVKQIEWGKGVSPEIVKEELSKDKYAVVFITLNETSTGIMNPIWDIGPIVKEHGALLCVDAVSCMAGIDIDVDKWGIDVVLASSQKCFALPPGLSVSSVSEAAFEKAKTVPNRGSYFDFITMKKKSETNETPSTPAIPHLRALNKMLDHILDEEGPENRYKRHAELAAHVREWAKKQGFEVFSEDGYHSNTVVTIRNNLNINVGLWVKKAIEKGFRFVDGYGDLKGKTFRIAAMGEITMAMLDEFLGVITTLLAEVK